MNVAVALKALIEYKYGGIETDIKSILSELKVKEDCNIEALICDLLQEAILQWSASNYFISKEYLCIDGRIYRIEGLMTETGVSTPINTDLNGYIYLLYCRDIIGLNLCYLIPKYNLMFISTRARKLRVLTDLSGDSNIECDIIFNTV